MKPQPQIQALIAAELPDTQYSPKDDLTIADTVMGMTGLRRAAWAVFNDQERAQIVRAARRQKEGKGQT